MADAESKLLVSLHDVSPRHAEAIEKILAWTTSQGLPPVQLLVVPDFHGKWPLSAYPDFCQRLRDWRDRGHELVLHGYFHLESQDRKAPLRGATERFKRSFMTAGEGEFLALDPQAAGRLIDRGLAMWEQAGLTPPPVGFVPPAWLHRPDLDAELWGRGFRWTENHQGFRTSDGGRVKSPVITWASRDPVRRIGSRIFCPSAVRLYKDAPLLRIAIHPHDFDHPQLVRSIERTIGLAKSKRESIGSVKTDQWT